MPSHVSNEETYSVEAGYYARLTDELTLRADIYHQWYQDLVGVIQTNVPEVDAKMTRGLVPIARTSRNNSRVQSTWSSTSCAHLPQAPVHS